MLRSAIERHRSSRNSSMMASRYFQYRSLSALRAGLPLSYRLKLRVYPLSREKCPLHIYIPQAGRFFIYFARPHRHFDGLFLSVCHNSVNHVKTAEVVIELILLSYNLLIP